MAFETQVREGGAWRTGLLVSAHETGAWRDVQEIWAREAGAWRQVYVRSDPLNLVFGPAWSRSYAESGGPVEHTFNGAGTEGGVLIQGDWDTVGHPSGTQRGKGAMAFHDIESAFGGRYKCTSFRVRLTVEASYTSLGIYPRVGVWQNTNFTGTSFTEFNHVHSDFQATGARTTEGNQVHTTMSTAAGDMLLNSTRNVVTTHDFGDGTGTADKEHYRGTFYGESALNDIEPKVDLVADYV